MKSNSIPIYTKFLFFVFALWVFITAPVLWQIKDVWLGSETYKHCFFVVPIAFYIVYSERSKLVGLQPRFEPLWFIPISANLFLWLFGIAGGVDVFTHIAVFCLLPLMILLIVGFSYGKTLWFPLVFVLFSIPLGEELVPQFQEITADMSVAMLKASGVPVFREGLFIDIPNGKFLVAEACSGIRFFVATVMLGAVAAYWMFTSTLKRVLFFSLAIILPILANSVRAYGTMMIGHVFGMEYAGGADHLVYGWFFFAFVIVVLLGIGHLFKDESPSFSDKTNLRDMFSTWTAKPTKLQVASLIFLFSLFWGWKHEVSQLPTELVSFDFTSVDQVTTQYEGTWSSSFVGATKHRMRGLKVNGFSIGLQIYAYTGAEEHAELVSWKNKIHDPDVWTSTGSLVRNIAGTIVTESHVVSNSSNKRTIWYWYEVPGYRGGSQLRVKLQQALNRLVGSGTEGVIYILSTPYNIDEQAFSEIEEELESIVKGFVLDKYRS